MSSDPARWDRGIDVLRQLGGGSHVPLLEAGKAGLLDLVLASRTAGLPFGRMRKAPRPVLVLVGDDDEFPTGPDGWKVTSQLTQWARGAIVHASGAERQHYEAAVRGALICQRFVLIETTSQHGRAWASLLGHVQTLVILPHRGLHPLPAPRGTVH